MSPASEHRLRPLRRIAALALAAAACVAWLPEGAHAQSPAYEITAERIERLSYTLGGRAIAQPFLYRRGDDPSWASPEHDDSDWTLASTYVQEDRGIGWYRLRLMLAPELAGEQLGLAVSSHGGPFEVYLDGQQILQSGRVAASAENERSGYALVPVPLSQLRVGDEHLLAIRFSNHGAASPVAAPTTGLRVVLGRYDALVQNRSMHVWQTTLFLALTLLLTFQHLLFYLFYRKRRENLYFALYTGAVALFFAAYFLYWISADAVVTGLSLRVWLATMAFFSVLALLFLYEIFQLERPRVFRVALVVAGAVAVWALVDPASAMVPSRVVLMLLSVEILRILYVAFRRRRPGAWLLAAAIVPMCLFMVVEQLAYMDVWRLPWLPYFSIVFYCFVLLVIAMAIYLARDFAKAHEEVTRAHAELEEANRTLEDQVAQRTEELRSSLEHLQSAQARLVEQEKMASLGALTAGIAHEIKNPLNFVNNFAALAAELTRELRESLAGETAAPADVGQILDDLEQNADKVVEHGRRADGIVRSMLMHSRGGTAQREKLDVNALATEYANLAYHGMRAQRSDFNCELEWDLDEGLPPVEGVPQDLGRVLLNVLNNAFYAVTDRARTNGAHPPVVAVQTRRAGAHVEVFISDTGPGIPEDVRRRIFEPFFTTKPTGEGTGLGLSMSHDIVVRGHGGTMEVESREGEGTTFIIRLPLAAEGLPVT